MKAAAKIIIALFLLNYQTEARGDEREEIVARLRSADNEISKLYKGPLNAVMLLYEKKPELFPFAPNVTPARWLNIIDLEILVRHAVSERKKADFILQSIDSQTKTEDKERLMRKTIGMIGAIESDTRGICGILRELYLPENDFIYAWLRLTQISDNPIGDKAYLGEKIKQLENKLDALFRKEINVAAHIATINQNGGYLRDLITDCGTTYLAPRFLAYDTLKRLIEPRAQITDETKMKILEELESNLENAVMKIEKEMGSIYHNLPRSETLSQWLKEGLKK